MHTYIRPVPQALFFNKVKYQSALGLHKDAGTQGGNSENKMSLAEAAG